MRMGAETASQISDDECQGGGICPSCRLAVNKDTGRLKWCMGGNDIWRTRIRFMLLIPAVILPVTIIIIALSKSTVIGKLSMRSAHSAADEPLPTASPLIGNDVGFIPTIRNDIDQAEVAERILHPDIETSFIPAESLITTHPLQRHKRDMSQRINEQAEQERSGAGTIGGAKATRRQSAAHSAEGLKGARLPSEPQLVPGHRGRGRNADKQIPGDLLNFLIKEIERWVLSVTTTSRGGSSFARITCSGGLVPSFANSRCKPTQARGDKGAGIMAELGDCDDEGEEDEEEEEESVEEGSEETSLEEEEESEEADEEGDEEGDESTSFERQPSRWRTRSRPLDDKDRRGFDDLSSYSEENDGSLDYRAFWKSNWDEDFIRKAQAKMMLKYMDRTADPCQDFYQYSCGNWQRYNPIPEDKAGFDTFETLRESLDLVLKQLLEEPSSEREDSAILKAKNLYRSCMNYEILERRMERPLLELLDRLGGWPILRPRWDPNTFDWLLLVAQLRLYNNDILISEWVGPDIKNSDQYVIQFDQTTLGLPTKDYFLQATNTIYLVAYKNYLITIATLLGATVRTASNQAEELIQFEIQLANITISPDERRNISDVYKRMTLDELHSMIPQIDWQRYLSIVLERPISLSQPVVLYASKYLQELVKLLYRTPRRVVANYLFWRFVRHRVNNLDDRFQEAKQTFYYILFGREKSPSRWKNCVAQVNSNMGMAVGSIFVRKYFDEKSKNDTLAMTHEIQRTFRELLNQSSWLDSMTKRVAGEKVEAMQLRIGYPDFILDDRKLDSRYRDVTIHPDMYFENTLNILRHMTRIEQDRLDNPVNKSIWNAAPAVVNAYYSRNKNQIMFPAGILQPPFYHRYFPRSLNFGGIGVVIGHEITHGFDDKGRLFDKDGNLHRWWKDDTVNEFDQRAACLVDQYSNYVVKEVSMRIDGVNTQGENIADNGGIKQAFRAYEKWLSTNENADERLPGLDATGRQLFFLNFAQIWCGSMRPEAMKNKLKTAVHSPGKYRVIGTLSNSDDFAKVFNCPLGTPMNPEKKCLVW